MKINKLLWGGLVILLVIALPGLFERLGAEKNDNTYEFTLPYEEIYELVEASDDLEIDEVLTTLQDAGLTTVSLSPVSLRSLQRDGVLSTYTELQLEDALRFNPIFHDFQVENKGYYITIPTSPVYEEFLNEQSESMITIGDEQLYFIPTSEDFDLFTPIGYNQEAIEKVQEHDFNYLLRVENNDSPEINQAFVEQIVAEKSDAFNRILFSGEDVIGYPERGALYGYAEAFQQAGFSFYTIEFTKLKGMETIARAADYDIIRLHSLDLNDSTLTENIDQAVRAVKERKIRSIFFHLPDADEPIESLNGAVSFMMQVDEKLPDQFQNGAPQPLADVDVPVWILAVNLLAGIVFTYLAFSYFRKPWLQLFTAGFMIFLAVAYVFFDRLVFLQGFALIIATLAPIYAIVSTAKGSTQVLPLFINYVKALGISLVGVLIMVGLLNGNGFLTGIELFRGVTVVYTVPIVVITLFALWMMAKQSIGEKGFKGLLMQGVRLLNLEVKYWHLLVLVVVGLLVLFYYGRQGNFGLALDFELQFRQWLEDTLYARPRTKEFLIGFPLYLLGLYLIGIKKNSGYLLLIPGVIGFLSVVNTFSHLHMPLDVSFLRTVYSVVLGFLIGLLAIYLFKRVYKYVTKIMKTGWS